MFRNTAVAPDLQCRPLRTAGLWMALALPVFTPTLLAIVTVQSVGVSPTTVPSGGSSTGTVTLNSTSPVAVSVALFSSKPSLASVPGKISMGKTLTATFPITTAPGQAGCAFISAQVVGTAPRPPAQLFVQPTNSPGPVTLALPPGNKTVVAGGQPMSAIVQSVQQGVQGAVVQLTSSNPQVTVVPASVTLNQTEGGDFQASFNINAAVNAAPTCAIITATFQGSQSRALVKVVIVSG